MKVIAWFRDRYDVVANPLLTERRIELAVFVLIIDFFERLGKHAKIDVDILGPLILLKVFYDLISDHNLLAEIVSFLTIGTLIQIKKLHIRAVLVIRHLYLLTLTVSVGYQHAAFRLPLPDVGLVVGVY